MREERFEKRIKLTSEILTKISKIDEFKGFWKGSVRLSPQVLGRLKRSVIITSSASSTRIEGAKMNDKEVARFLGGIKSRIPKGRDEQENAGYADLLGRIFDNYKTLKLSEGQILQFHDILLKFSIKDQKHRGKYKTMDNVVIAKGSKNKNIILFRPTKPYLVQKEMSDIIFWTSEQFDKKEIHSLLIIANFLFEFLAIHPFHDGNGRLSRALTNLLLLKEGYTYTPYVSLEEIVEGCQSDYYLSLRTTQKNHKSKKEDITPWVNFFLDTLLEQIEKAKNIMREDQPEKLLSGKQLLVFRLFNKNSTLSVLEIYEKLGNRTPKATIKQALSRLLVLRMIERIGQGRGTRYRKL